MFFASLASTLESIIHSYLVFMTVMILIMVAAKYLYPEDIKQTKAVEAFMSLGALLTAFGIPYVTLSFSRVHSLSIIIIIPILVAALASYFLNKKTRSSRQDN